MKDVCKELNYPSADVDIFLETPFSVPDSDNFYGLNAEKKTLFRNYASTAPSP